MTTSVPSSLANLASAVLKFNREDRKKRERQLQLSSNQLSRR